MAKFEVGDLVQWRPGTVLYTVVDSVCAWCRLRSPFGAEFDVPETELKFVEPSREDSDCPISDEQYELELINLALNRRNELERAINELVIFDEFCDQLVQQLTCEPDGKQKSKTKEEWKEWLVQGLK